MTAIEKFTFSLSFDDADNVIRSAGDEDEHYELGKKKKKKKEETPPPPPPVYTEEQGEQMVADAQKAGHEQGFAEGHKQGFDEAHQQIMASLEKAVGDVESEIAEKLAQIDEQQKRANAKINEDAIHVALGVIRKLAPAWSAQYDLTEIENIVQQCLANLFEAPKVMIKVHPDLETPVREAAERIAMSRGFSGKVIVVGEPDVATGDCLVSWGDGTAVRDSARVWSEINAIVDNALDLHASDHDLPKSDMGDAEIQESRIPDESTNTKSPAPAEETFDQSAAELETPQPLPHTDAPEEQVKNTNSSDQTLDDVADQDPVSDEQNAADIETPSQAAPSAPHRQEGDGTDARNMQTSQDDTISEPASAHDASDDAVTRSPTPEETAAEPAPQSGAEVAQEDRTGENEDHGTATAPRPASEPAPPDSAPPANGPTETQENPTTTADEMAAVKQPTKDAGDENG